VQKRGKPAPEKNSKTPLPDEFDLARAYALRARSEADERKQAQAEAAAKAQQRKQRKLKLQKALAGRALNKPDAELPRHFEFGGKIRRVYVDAGQMADLNAGTLALVQYGGSYLLVERAVALDVLDFAPEQVALLVDHGVAASDDGVPDDLSW
jgi:uncharacterized protein YaiL (DUF2058 family)